MEGNFLAGRTFWNVTDLNESALQWCETQNGKFHREIDGVPESLHCHSCGRETFTLKKDPLVLEYLCPLRRLSFDGFVSYEGRRFGVPASYRGATARVQRKGHELLIYSPEMDLLVTHEVTWSKADDETNGLAVTCIGSDAFADCQSLVSLTIPDSVTYIDEMAFALCSSLESASLGDSVTSIGESAFAYCESLTSITIPDSVTDLDVMAQ